MSRCPSDAASFSLAKRSRVANAWHSSVPKSTDLPLSDDIEAAHGTANGEPSDDNRSPATATGVSGPEPETWKGSQRAYKSRQDQDRPAGLPFYSCAVSELGHVRKVNEDAFLDAREQALWVVADGMGGHSRGDRASQTVISSLQSFESKATARENIDELLKRLQEANARCRQSVTGQVIGSTVAALFLHQQRTYLLWAGDSRIYRVRQGVFEQLTDDHSLVQELHRLGELSAEEAENHPSSNVITRAIGVADEADIQVRQLDLQAGDRFLLCSDGLFKDVRPHEVEARLTLPSPQQALDELVRLALRRGGSDNITAIVVQVAIH